MTNLGETRDTALPTGLGRRRPQSWLPGSSPFAPFPLHTAARPPHLCAARHCRAGRPRGDWAVALGPGASLTPPGRGIRGEAEAQGGGSRDHGGPRRWA